MPPKNELPGCGTSKPQWWQFFCGKVDSPASNVDILYVIAGQDEPPGLSIKDELEGTTRTRSITGSSIRIPIRSSTKARPINERTTTRLQRMGNANPRPAGSEKISMW